MRILRQLLSIFAVLSVIVLIACSSETGTGTGADANAETSDSGNSLRTDKSEYVRGETITLTYAGIERPASQDWISVYKLGTPNENYGQWYYLGARSEGTLTFNTPSEAGDYEFRLFLDWPAGGYNDVAKSDTIRILEPQASTSAGTGTLSLDSAGYAPGGAISVNFTASTNFARNAWVGIIPSDVSHGSEAQCDQYDVSYRYIEGRSSGAMSFTAPQSPGRYDMRMFDTDDNGKEVTSVSFEVRGGSTSGTSTLTMEYDIYEPGETVEVSFTAPGHFSRDAWVGIIPSNVAHGSESECDRYDISYQYIEGRTSGVMKFAAPMQPGEYDMRMFDTDSGGVEVAHRSFEVE